MDLPGGLLLITDMDLAADETYLSDPIFIPREAIRLLLDLTVAKLPGGHSDPDIDVKFRQGATGDGGTLPDRGLTVPAALSGVSASHIDPARVAISDDVVGHFVQIEITPSTDGCRIVAARLASR